jgi:hypothetical protein
MMLCEISLLFHPFKKVLVSSGKSCVVVSLASVTLEIMISAVFASVFGS